MPPARAAFWVATLGGIVLAIRSVLHGPPALWISLTCALGYLTIVLSGVFVLRLRMYADAIVRGPEGSRGVALTFDDGPDPRHTRAVLDILDARSAKATFFVIGKKTEAHPEVVAEIVRRGHDVGLHGYDHDRLFSLRGPRRVRRDLERAIRAVEKITKKKPLLFRPPIGHTNPTIARIAEQLGLSVVGWSVAGYDGIARAVPGRVAARVKRGLEDGAIVLLHDAAERGDHEPAGVAALEAILDGLEARNLRAVSLAAWKLDAD